jgi:sugar phosphate isomerase/epimerase
MTRSLGIAGFEYPLPPEQLFPRVRSLGVRYCELAVPTNLTPETAGRVAELAAASDVIVTAVATLSKLNSSDDVAGTQKLINDSIECAGRLGAPFVITYFGGHPSRGHDEAIRRYAEHIQPCLERAERRGVAILIENHFSHAAGEVTNTADGCVALFEAIGSPRFRLNFDPCNFCIGAEEYFPYAYRLLRPYTLNVHLKDARKYRAALHGPYHGRIVHDLRQGEFIFVAMGDGAVCSDAIVQALQEDGFDGPITIEAHTPHETLDGVFRTGIDYCRKRGL